MPARPLDTETLLPLPEVAQRLAVCVSTVRRLIRSHGLPVHRIGGQLRVRAADLDHWVAARRVHQDRLAAGEAHHDRG